MNLLSLSSLYTIQSPLIPLYVLNQRYFKRMDAIKNLFLIPQIFHEEFGRKGVNVLPIDFSNTKIKVDRTDSGVSVNKEVYEMLLSAYDIVKPEIILDNYEPLSAYLSDNYSVPRISIQRTGLFRSIEKNERNPRHRHSLEILEKGSASNFSMILNPQSRLSKLRFENYKYINNSGNIDFLKSYIFPKTKIVPGIPTLEQLPEGIEDRDSFFFSGPLLVEDSFDKELFEDVDQFFSYNKGRKIIFFSVKQINKELINRILSYLLTKGFAVMTTNEYNISADFKNRFFSKSFLPLNKVCSMSDLIIHHCGSSIYHYPLLHKKPFLTIGTQFYDWEDIALRLQELNVSKHVPSARDNDNYWEIFCEYIELFEKGSLTDYDQLEKLEKSIYETMLNFDMEEVINYTLS